MFGDTSVAAQVLEATSLYVMKSLGYKINNLIRDKWIKQIPSITKVALFAKFIQNPVLKTILLKSENNILVESIPKRQNLGNWSIST